MSKLTQATELAEKSSLNSRLTKASPKLAKLSNSQDSPRPSSSKDRKEKIKKEKILVPCNSMPSIIGQNSSDQNPVDDSYEEDSDDIKFTYTDESYQFPKIKAASIDKLIERLTHEIYPGNSIFNYSF